MKAPGFLWASLAVVFQSAFAQAPNLVPNPGFESSLKCPGNYSEAPAEFTVIGWSSATLGTPDQFNGCSEGEADVPYNWAGVSEAYEGRGYAGIYVWMSDLPYREYLQCRLLKPLTKDSVYQIEFHYKLSSYSRYAIDRIGLLLSDSAVQQRHDKVLNFRPTLSVIRDSALTKTTGLWETAQLKYKAHGGESYLTIGNFFDNPSTRAYAIQFRPSPQEMLARSAYYYVDDVRVIPEYELKKLKSLRPEFSLTDAKTNVNYVLQNIQFEFDSYRLMVSSFYELDQVGEYLLRHPRIRVQLFGHTDDLGGDNYNQKLSFNRAKTVAEYLTTLGIRKERLEFFGYGKSKPLINGKTEEARKTNRRVEIRFIQ